MCVCACTVEQSMVARTSVVTHTHARVVSNRHQTRTRRFTPYTHIYVHVYEYPLNPKP